MLSTSKPAKLILYLVCAAIIGQTFIYLIARYSEIYDALFGSHSLLTALYISYLTLLLVWSFVVLIGLNRKELFAGIFTYVLLIILIYSVGLITVFHFFPIQEFQPLELIYVAYDMSILAVIMSVLCWLIGKVNIGGILKL
jgi:hypothetical protein